MLKQIGIVFGLAFALVGVAGFVPALAPDGLLLGAFAVNGAHNLVHLVTGIVALAIAFARPASMRAFFRVFGLVYGLVAVLGMFSGDAPLLGIIAHNHADMWLHVAIAAVSLWLGFGFHDAAPIGAA